ncbi:DUF4232 domain-containing protein [Streptomyces sp. NPDC087917]|uniref:DUF4232 domain-containing protein n=1 Tax=unclassified Streptomyces TaxID=2593676 RepID=UPI0034287377
MNATARAHHRSRKTYALGAVALAALLASTACDPNTGDASDGGRPSGRPGATGAATPGASGSATPGGSGSPAAGGSASPTPGGTSPTARNSPAPGATAPTRPNTPKPGATGSPKASGSPGAVAATCADADLKTSSTNEDEAGRPVRHVLLTVTNTGAEACTVHSYPTVRLGADSRAPVGVIEDSDPKALLTLAPGRQAHAALLVSGGHMDEYQALTLTVALRGPAPGDKPGEPLPVALPGVDRLWADDGARVTYWSTASGFALRFIMSS